MVRGTWYKSGIPWLTPGAQSDALLLDADKRGVEDDLKLQVEAVTRLSPDEKRVIRELIEGMRIKHEVKRWTVPA